MWSQSTGYPNNGGRAVYTTLLVEDFVTQLHLLLDAFPVVRLKLLARRWRAFVKMQILKALVVGQLPSDP
jgi:hypothetical protein